MGDRANVVLLQHASHDEVTGRIYLYSHWGGAMLPVKLRDILNSQPAMDRREDEPYLGRIIMEGLLPKDSPETGFGLSTYLTDNEYNILVVDIEKSQVFVEQKPNWRVTSESPRPLGDPIAFDRYCALSDAQVCAFRDTGNVPVPKKKDGSVAKEG